MLWFGGRSAENHLNRMGLSQTNAISIYVIVAKYRSPNKSGLGIVIVWVCLEMWGLRDTGYWWIYWNSGCPIQAVPGKWSSTNGFECDIRMFPESSSDDDMRIATDPKGTSWFIKHVITCSKQPFPITSGHQWRKRSLKTVLRSSHWPFGGWLVDWRASTVLLPRWKAENNVCTQQI